ncbi:MAG TPA: 4'-phosphopantetheinyl transferase superfamily protein [Streptosporangiaceae bacterium]|jgi:4'-phosphopantetheinyl transferase EntD
MIEDILPAEVISAEAFDDTADAYLFPEEQAIIVNAVEARRREFGTVRRCAREALTGLGYPPAPLLPGQERAPQWPAGIVGSMTHCTDYRTAIADARRARGTVVAEGTAQVGTGRGAVAVAVARVARPCVAPDGAYRDYRAAAVGLNSVVRTIGIDAEPNLPLPDGVLDLVSLPEERHQLAGLRRAGHIRWAGDGRGGGSTVPDQELVHWDRLLFSCKETIYKAWYPLARRWLGFEDAVVSIDPVSAVFTARILVSGPVIDGAELRGFRGHWLAQNGLLVTAIAVLI